MTKNNEYMNKEHGNRTLARFEIIVPKHKSGLNCKIWNIICIINSFVDDIVYIVCKLWEESFEKIVTAHHQDHLHYILMLISFISI